MTTKPKPSRKRYRKTTDRFQNTVFYLETKKDEAPITEVLLDTAPQKSYIRKEHLKRKERRFVKKLAALGAFKNFSQKAHFRALKKGVVPKGYAVCYFIPPNVGGSYEESNMIVTLPAIARLMDEFYWKQIEPFVNKERYIQERHKLRVVFRSVPRMFNANAF